VRERRGIDARAARALEHLTERKPHAAKLAAIANAIAESHTGTVTLSTCTDHRSMRRVNWTSARRLKNVAENSTYRRIKPSRQKSRLSFIGLVSV
jgi:hypothetical protein